MPKTIDGNQLPFQRLIYRDHLRLIPTTIATDSSRYLRASHPSLHTNSDRPHNFVNMPPRRRPGSDEGSPPRYPPVPRSTNRPNPLNLPRASQDMPPLLSPLPDHVMQANPHPPPYNTHPTTATATNASQHPRPAQNPNISRTQPARPPIPGLGGLVSERILSTGLRQSNEAPATAPATATAMIPEPSAPNVNDSSLSRNTQPQASRPVMEAGGHWSPRKAGSRPVPILIVRPPATAVAPTDNAPPPISRRAPAPAATAASQTPAVAAVNSALPMPTQSASVAQVNATRQHFPGSGGPAIERPGNMAQRQRPEIPTTVPEAPPPNFNDSCFNLENIERKRRMGFVPVTGRSPQPAITRDASNVMEWGAHLMMRTDAPRPTSRLAPTVTAARDVASTRPGAGNGDRQDVARAGAQISTQRGDGTSESTISVASTGDEMIAATAAAATLKGITIVRTTGMDGRDLDSLRFNPQTAQYDAYSPVYSPWSGMPGGQNYNPYSAGLALSHRPQDFNPYLNPDPNNPPTISVTETRPVSRNDHYENEMRKIHARAGLKCPPAPDPRTNREEVRGPRHPSPEQSLPWERERSRERPAAPASNPGQGQGNANGRTEGMSAAYRRDDSLERHLARSQAQAQDRETLAISAAAAVNERHRAPNQNTNRDRIQGDAGAGTEKVTDGARQQTGSSPPVFSPTKTPKKAWDADVREQRTLKTPAGKKDRQSVPSPETMRGEAAVHPNGKATKGGKGGKGGNSTPMKPQPKRNEKAGEKEKEKERVGDATTKKDVGKKAGKDNKKPQESITIKDNGKGKQPTVEADHASLPTVAPAAAPAPKTLSKPTATPKKKWKEQTSSSPLPRSSPNQALTSGPQTPWTSQATLVSSGTKRKAAERSKGRNETGNKESRSRPDPPSPPSSNDTPPTKRARKKETKPRKGRRKAVSDEMVIDSNSASDEDEEGQGGEKGEAAAEQQKGQQKPQAQKQKQGQAQPKTPSQAQPKAQPKTPSQTQPKAPTQSAANRPAQNRQTEAQKKAAAAERAKEEAEKERRERRNESSRKSNHRQRENEQLKLEAKEREKVNAELKQEIRRLNQFQKGWRDQLRDKDEENRNLRIVINSLVREVEALGGDASGRGSAARGREVSVQAVRGKRETSERLSSRSALDNRDERPDGEVEEEEEKEEQEDETMEDFTMEERTEEQPEQGVTEGQAEEEDDDPALQMAIQASLVDRDAEKTDKKKPKKVLLNADGEEIDEAIFE